MSAKTKNKSTTSPVHSIIKNIDNRLKKAEPNPDGTPKTDEKNPNTKPKSGSKADRRRTKSPGAGVRKLRRKGSQKDHSKKDTTKEGVEMSVANTIKYIIENHGRNVKDVFDNYGDTDTLSKLARKCMATCLSGWTENDGSLVSENTDLVLSKNSWEIAEDGSAKLKDGGFQFDYDWLYNLSNANMIKEDIDIGEGELDKDIFSDTLSNASNLLRKLSDKEIKKYVLNAVKDDEDVDVMNLKDILEDTGVNWKFVGAEIQNEKINLLVKVKYTKDGTQEGVVEKKLSIEVKPIADVTDTTSDREPDDEVDLGFNSKPKPDAEAGLDIGVDL